MVTEAFYGRWGLLERASDERFTRHAHLRHFFLFVTFSEMQPLPVVYFALFEGSGKITVQTSSYLYSRYALKLCPQPKRLFLGYSYRI
jgi:hypothetical protein